MKVKSNSLENRLSKIYDAVFSKLSSSYNENDEPSEYGIISTFDESVIVKNFSSDDIFEIEYSVEDDDIVLGEVKYIDEAYVIKSIILDNPKISPEDARDLISGEKLLNANKFMIGNQIILSGPIVQKNKKKRIAYAAVLVPGEKDYDGEEVTKERIEDACHEWMDAYQNLDLEHSLNNVGRPIENYLTYSERVVKSLDGEELVLPEGTWIIGSKLDEETFEAVEKGELVGYSIMGIRRAALKGKDMSKALKSFKDDELKGALKKVLLKDLGPDWVPVSVAVTGSPAVPKSKWFALKSKEAVEENKSLGEKIKGFLTPSEKAGRRFSKDTVSKLKKALEALDILIKEAQKEDEKYKKNTIRVKGGKNMEITKDELKEMIDEAVKSSLEEIGKETSEKSEEEVEEKEEKATAEKSEDEEVKEEKAEKSQEAKEEKPEKNEEVEALKSKLEETSSTVDKLVKALKMDFSKSIKGQDEEDVETEKAVKDFGSRDSFGRKIKKEDK